MEGPVDQILRIPTGDASKSAYVLCLPQSEIIKP